MLNNIKLIVTDMDGTLLNKSQELGDYTIETFKKIQDQGVKIVLASGRSYKTLLTYGEQLKMHEYGGYYIGANGAAITETKRMQHQIIRQIEPAELKEIFEVVSLLDVEMMAVQDETIFDYIPDALMNIKKQFRIDNHIADDVPMTAGTFSIVVDQRRGYKHIHYVNNFDEIDVSVNKVCIAHQQARINEIYPILEEKLGDKFHFVMTSPQWIECTPLGINKGNAINKILLDENIHIDNVLIFGDGENDLSMLNLTCNSVAMKNAMPKVKAQCTYETAKDNNTEGVADFINNHLLK